MGFLDTVGETARRAATGDDWYVANRGYVIEIRAFGLAALELGLPSVFILLPVAPENYRVNRVMRQSVTPTLGGLVAEERGLLWREIEVSGTFGLRAKPTIDTAIKPEPAGSVGGVALAAIAGLSGPGWTKRLVDAYFEKYAAMKANPQYASDVTMIWHDLKFDTHWVVVPENIEIARTPQRRFQYPFTMRFKAVADSFFPISIPVSALSALGSIRNAVSKVNSALALVNSAVQEGSAILGEVRYFAAGIDSVLDKVTVIASSAEDFVNGVDDTLSIGKTFIQSTQALMDEVLGLLETTEELPDSVRQNYQMAADGMDAMAAQQAAFGTTYQATTDAIAASERGAAATSRDDRDAAARTGPASSAAEFDNATVRSTDNDLVESGNTESGRAFGRYTSFRTYDIQATDTLQSIAAKLLGDGAKWYDIAIVNGLRSPYISDTGAPGTVGVGDLISIPVIGGTSAQNAIVSGQNDEPGTDLLGTDIASTEPVESAPGRPLVDLAIDQSTFKDIKIVSSVANLTQALQLRMWTEQGRLPLSPSYGLPRVIGVNVDQGQAELYALSLKSTLSADSRVRSVSGVRLEKDGDLLDVDANVIPIGYDNAVAVSTAVV
jgi:hypothetical protein